MGVAKDLVQGTRPSCDIQNNTSLLHDSHNGQISLANNMSSNCGLHDDEEVLNTYFLSSSSSEWGVIDEKLSLYSITFPLAAVAEWMPVLTPHTTGTSHSAVSSERFLLDWAVLEEDAKILGKYFFSYPFYALRSAAAANWSRLTVERMIKSGEVVPRYKSSTTVMLDFPSSPYLAVGDVLNIRILNSKPAEVSLFLYFFNDFKCRCSQTLC